MTSLALVEELLKTLKGFTINCTIPALPILFCQSQAGSPDTGRLFFVLIPGGVSPFNSWVSAFLPLFSLSWVRSLQPKIPSINYDLGFGYDKLTTTAASQDAFVFLYCLANFFQNFGPNSTTFIVPGEVFPTRYRSTGHGISAASGKLGAIVAQVIVTQIGGARLRSIESPNPFVKRM